MCSALTVMTSLAKRSGPWSDDVFVSYSHPDQRRAARLCLCDVIEHGCQKSPLDVATWCRITYAGVSGRVAGRIPGAPELKIGVAECHRLGLISRRFARETGMRGGPLAAVLLCTAQALAWGAVAPAQAQVSDAPPLTPPLSPPSLDPSIKPLPPPPEGQTSPPPAAAVPEASPSPPLAAPDAAPAEPPLAQETGPTAGDPVVAAIRSQLADPAIRKDADAGDFAALAGILRGEDRAVRYG